MTTIVSERTTVPPIVCAPWCVHHDGHPNQIFIEDQRCETEYLTVDLLLEPPLVDVDSGNASPERVAVYAERSPDNPLRLLFGLVDERPAFVMTPAEAQDLMEHVQLLLGQIGAGR